MIKERIEKIINTGIYSDTSFKEKNRLRINNSAVLISSLMGLIYVPVLYSLNLKIGALINLLFFSFILICSFYLNYKRKYDLALNAIFIALLAYLISFNWTYGLFSEGLIFFCYLPVVVAISFERKKHSVKFLVLTLVSYSVSYYLIFFVKPLYQIEEIKFLSYPSGLLTILLVYDGVMRFKKENFKHQQTIEEQSKELSDKNEELHQQNEEILSQRDEIEFQKKLLEEKNKEITDSISYAKKIQDSLLPSDHEIKKSCEEYFIFFKPKDIVSGDFYWFGENGTLKFFAAADCTGHGVPGGFMSMLGITFLNDLVLDKKLIQTDAILNSLRENIKYTLNKSKKEGASQTRDGMDIALCCIDEKTHELFFSGANNPIWIIRSVNNFPEIIELKADKQPVGVYEKETPFSVQKFQLMEGDRIYAFSDGFADQFGGPKNKKYKYTQLKDLLLKYSSLNIHEQRKVLEKSFETWKADNEQVDDVLIIGVKC